MTERRFDQAVTKAEAALALVPYHGRIVYYLAGILMVARGPELVLEWIEANSISHVCSAPMHPQT